MDKGRRNALVALGPANFLAAIALVSEWSGNAERAPFRMLAAIFAAVVQLGARDLTRESTEPMMEPGGFDRVAVALAKSGSRRVVLGLLAAVPFALAAPGAEARRGRRRCRRVGATCPANRPCCTGASCADGVCACPSNRERCGGVCCPVGEECCNHLANNCALPGVICAV